MSKKIIKIVKGGPYIAGKNIPVKISNIVEEEHINVWSGCEDFPVVETIALCRCGKSKNKPFCDGAHAHEGFDGEETASRSSYRERSELLDGKGVDLLDDGRCVYAGFCYIDNRDVWELTQHSSTDYCKKAAIEGASACPSGRLTAVEKNGNIIEPKLEEEIVVIESEWGKCGLFVKGGIDLESSDGTLYENRNRYVLCCCGKSKNKPFCDASHMPDEAKKKEGMSGDR